MASPILPAPRIAIVVMVTRMASLVAHGDVGRGPQERADPGAGRHRHLGAEPAAGGERARRRRPGTPGRHRAFRPAAGLLLSLPTLSFAPSSGSGPAARRAVRFAPHRRARPVAALVAGQLIRSLLPGPLALFVGLPARARRHRGGQRAAARPGAAALPGDRTGDRAYTTLLTIGGAAAAGLTLPIQQALGGDWRPGIGMWAALALLALAPWLALAHRATAPAAADHGTAAAAAGAGHSGGLGAGLLLRLQSMLAYVIFGWLPEILTDAGMSDTAAAAQVALIAVHQLPLAAVAPALVAGARNPRWIVLLFGACYLGGFLGLLFASPATRRGSVGPDRHRHRRLPAGADPHRAAVQDRPGHHALSAFTQCGGYLIASVGPIGFGVLLDLSGGWTVPLLALCAVVAPRRSPDCRRCVPRYVEDELPAARRLTRVQSGESAARWRSRPGPRRGRSARVRRWWCRPPTPARRPRRQHACASARRGASRGVFATTCTDALTDRSRRRAPGGATSASRVTPAASAQRGSSVPNTAPRSPRPAADSSASHSACAATSPSECPAQPSASGELQPGEPAGPAGLDRMHVHPGADPDAPDADRERRSGREPLGLREIGRRW